jgi:hypothetical protein
MFLNLAHDFHRFHLKHAPSWHRIEIAALFFLKSIIIPDHEDLRIEIHYDFDGITSDFNVVGCG